MAIIDKNNMGKTWNYWNYYKYFDIILWVSNKRKGSMY